MNGFLYNNKEKKVSNMQINEDNISIKVSVIIPVYNVEKYLSECLDSVTHQTLKDIEIICINDGSTDKSLDILKKYASKDSRIIVINQNNQGVSSARNRGLKDSRGRYISFIDGDDAVHPEFLQKLYQALQKNKKADFAWCNFIEGKEQKYSIINSENFPIIYDNPFEHYIMRKKPKMNALWNKLYSKQLLQGLSFPEDLHFGEDLVFLFQVLYKAKVAAYIPDTMYFYRYRPNSAMNNKLSEQRINDELEVAIKLKVMFKKAQISSKQKRCLEGYIAKRLYSSVINFTKQKDKENYLYWYLHYLPVLQQLEKEKIFIPENLSWKNKMLYRFYLQRSKKTMVQIIKQMIFSYTKENGSFRIKFMGITLLSQTKTFNLRKIYFLGIPIIKIERQIKLIKEQGDESDA